MTEQGKPDPLVGFHFDDFDEDTKALTIRIHKKILPHPDQKKALIAKLTEVLAYDGSIDKITVTPRD
ncbi:MAG: hypothetical protein ABSG18_23740 [Steroidobacteraceae bacterium]